MQRAALNNSVFTEYDTMSKYVLDKEKTVLETRRPVPSLPRLRSRLARTDRRRIAPSVTPRAPSQREAENNNISFRTRCKILKYYDMCDKKTEQGVRYQLIDTQ